MSSQALSKLEQKIEKLPDNPGVYYFLASGTKKLPPRILYIGKATSLKSRVRSYLAKDLMSRRGPLIARMIGEIEDIKYKETDSVLEALILEASEIKKHHPYYNSREKDDKSHNYVVLTKEEYPRVLVLRGRDLSDTQEAKSYKVEASYGPFPSGAELREALKIVRRIFPFRDEKCKLIGKPCFPAQLGLCPGPCAGWISKKDYRRNIRHIKMFFEARKPALIRSLEREMKSLAKEKKFEEAERTKRQIFALDHIEDIALMKRDLEHRSDRAGERVRIEAYDIAHLSGKDTVGVMVVAEDGELEKSQYRKFKIRGKGGRVGVDDTANLKEVITRRLGHPEWPLPHIMAVDGGTAQMNAAKSVLREKEFNIAVVAVTKDERHKARDIVGAKRYIEKHGRSILLANAEAHRFAISYHRKLRGKGFRI